MQLKAVHYKGIALSGAGPVLGVIVSAVAWFNNNVTTPTATKVCVDGLPLTVVAGVAGLVTVAGVVAGVLVLLKAPSTDPKVSVAAAVATGQVLPVSGSPVKS
jgi:hypothetical protein